MYRSHFGRRRLTGLLVLAVAGIAAIGAYAFTASNTVPAHDAGAGANVVSGYTISSPSTYTFSADGKYMVGVTFDLDKAASDVQVALSAADPVQADWGDCGATVGLSHTATCTFPSPVAVADGTNLSVAAVSTGQVVIAP